MRCAIIDELREEYEPRKGEIPTIPENEVHQDGQPFVIAGYGVNSFFDIMKRLVYMFLVITCICIPMMGIYAGNREKGAKQLEKPKALSPMNSFTLGNMGGSDAKCMTRRL